MTTIRHWLSVLSCRLVAHKRIAQLQRECEDAKALVRCAYCPAKFDRRIDGWEEQLTAHLESCEKHPLHRERINNGGWQDSWNTLCAMWFTTLKQRNDAQARIAQLEQDLDEAMKERGR